MIRNICLLIQFINFQLIIVIIDVLLFIFYLFFYHLLIGRLEQINLSDFLVGLDIVMGISLIAELHCNIIKSQR